MTPLSPELTENEIYLNYFFDMFDSQKYIIRLFPMQFAYFELVVVNY